MTAGTMNKGPLCNALEASGLLKPLMNQGFRKAGKGIFEEDDEWIDQIKNELLKRYR